MSSTEETLRAFEAAVASGLPASWDWQQPVLIAVSGGGDSMALLRAVVAIAPAGFRRRLLVAHAEHDLRATATRDRQFVLAQARRLGLACHCRRLPLAAGTGTGGEGVEGAARQLRYRFFTELAHAHGARHVAVGHTLDDQAETILHRVLRGTGIAGLAGMPRARQLAEGVGLVRPLLGLRRWQPRAYLQAGGHLWMEDESNADSRYARNLLRQQVFAALEQGPYPAATEAVARLGQQAAAVMADRAATVGWLVREAVELRPDGSVLLRKRLATLADRDSHLLADVLLCLWQQQGWPRQELSHRHLGQVARMVNDRGSGDTPAMLAVSLPGAIEARWHPGGICLQRSPSGAVPLGESAG